MRLVLVFVVLLAAVGLAGCNGDGGDQDGDGLSDGMERRGFDIYIDLLGQRILRHVNSDPLHYDTDNDGLSDFDEWAFPGLQGNSKPGLDPRDADTDDDGLTDCQEAVHTVRADCENSDFAGPYDGGYGTSPSDADSDPGFGRYWGKAGNMFLDPYRSLPAPRDSGDGLPDGREIHGYNVTIGNRVVPITSNPLDTDSDGDGLYDGEEALIYSSNPRVPDTDGDGCTDSRDPVPDRAEKYHLGLDQFKLVVDYAPVDPSKGADLQFTFVMNDRVLRQPSTGSRAVQYNQTVSVADFDPGAQLPNCGAEFYPPGPFHPWLYIQLLASHVGTSPRNLDIMSVSQLGVSEAEPGELFWNVRTGQFSWTIAGKTPFAGPLHLIGNDAELRLNPRLE